MAHEQETFTGETGLVNIDSVFFKIVNEETDTPGFSKWFAPNPADEALIDQAIEATFTDRTDLPSWENFISFIGKATDAATAQRIEDEFVKGYRFLLFSDEERSEIDLESPLGSDWQLLTDADLVDPESIRDQFIAAFNHLTAEWPRPGLAEVLPNEFKRVFEAFMARSVLLENTSLVDLPEDLTEFTNVELVGSYEEVFDEFFPIQGLTSEERREIFEVLITSFAEQQIEVDGYFIPTLSFKEWPRFLEISAALRIFGKSTSLESIGAEEVLILDRIFLLLARMIEILQAIAAVQSERLLFLTEWQKAYTALIEQIPIFIGGDGTFPGRTIPGDKDDKEFAALRNDLNQLNTTFKEKLTANRQIISDDAKALQSAINQSTDAVTQQANIASSILEQLSTLLAAIYR